MSGGPRIATTAEKIAEIRQFAKEGKTAKEIANVFSMPIPTVSRFLSKFRKSGDAPKYEDRSLADRFARRWIGEPNSGCWLWEGSTDSTGYGQLRAPSALGGRLLRATHVSLELVGRMVPHGLEALHHCDNPYCVNPDHLFIGTKKDNTQDCIRKGRHSPPPSTGAEGSRQATRIRMQITCGPDHQKGKNLYVSPKGYVGCYICRKRYRLKRRSRARVKST